MLECAMGFDYDIAIISGYKFFELVEYGNFSYQQLGTMQLGAMYDMSRKMYKLLLIKGRFEDAKRFAGKTVYISNSIGHLD